MPALEVDCRGQIKCFLQKTSSVEIVIPISRSKEKFDLQISMGKEESTFTLRQ